MKNEIRSIPQEVMDNADFQHDIYTASIDYDSFTSDGWRCDFCEPNCTCDEDFLTDRAGEIASKYLGANGAKFSAKAIDTIEDLILERRGY